MQSTIGFEKPVGNKNRHGSSARRAALCFTPLLRASHGLLLLQRALPRTIIASLRPFGISIGINHARVPSDNATPCVQRASNSSGGISPWLGLSQTGRFYNPPYRL